MKKVKLSQEDLPIFEQMTDFFQDYFAKCLKGEKSPAELPLEFESLFGKDVDFYLKQKAITIGLLWMQRMFIPLELRQMYCSYLGEMTRLAQKLNLDGPLEYAVLFTHLLHEGCISLNGKFNFENSNFEQEDILGILPIFDNKGVCRNHAAACSDFLSFSFDDDEISSIVACCNLKLTNESINEMFDRKLDAFTNSVKVAKVANTSLFSFVLTTISNLFYENNHMITLIKSNSEIFGLDCTNCQIVKILNSEFAQSVPLPSLKTFDYHLHTDFSTELFNNGDPEYFRINALLANNNYDILEDDELKLRFKSAFKKIIANENATQYINSFCENTRKLREEMLLFASTLQIPSYADIIYWWELESNKYQIGFYPKASDTEYTDKSNYVKRK